MFVTGYSVGAHSEQDYATIAYNAATGARVWIKRYNGPGGNYDAANSVTEATTGGRCSSPGSAPRKHRVRLCDDRLQRRHGRGRWVDRYNGPANGYDEARSIAAARHGAKVFLTGYSEGAGSGSDFATVAYNSVTGDRLWVRRYNGPGNESDEASQVAVGPDGRKIFVAGASASAASLDYATVAYDALTGSRLWVKRYDGPGNDLDGANSVAVSPDGRRVFVTGDSIGSGSSFDYATIAYWARSGDPLWVKRYNGPGNGIDAARSVLISPDGRIAFITGGSDGIASGRDYATVAYDAVTGHRLLVRRYNGPGDNWDTAFSMAISPAGWTIVVTGESVGRTTHFDYATVAYRA